MRALAIALSFAAGLALGLVRTTPKEEARLSHRLAACTARVSRLELGAMDGPPVPMEER